MSHNQHRGKKLSGRIMDLLSGGDGASFDRKHRKSGRYARFGWAVAAILAVCASVYLLKTYGFGSKKQTNTAKVLLEDESFDPLRQFDAVLETGNLEQLRNLLEKLEIQNYRDETAPVKLDIDRKKIRVADRVLDHSECPPEYRVPAARAKMKSLWQLFLLGRELDFIDPDIFEKLDRTTDRFLDDPDRQVSRDAHTYRAKLLILEFLDDRLPGGLESVKNAMLDMLRDFPDDSAAMSNLKSMIRTVALTDIKSAKEIALGLSDVATGLGMEQSQELDRYLKDILLLYESGIGDLPRITDISVDDEEFLARLEKLNADPDTGPMVVRQLDNSIDYFEAQGQNDKARAISQRLLDDVSRRTDPEAAELAERLGESGVRRNSLVGKEWSFEEIDSAGRKIDEDQFANQVTLIFFYRRQSRRSEIGLRNLERQLARGFRGGNLTLVMVEVDDGDDGDDAEVVVERAPSRTESDNFQRVHLATSRANPNRYLQQCPTQRLPYLVLIGKNGMVDSINVSSTALTTRIEYLLAKQ